MITIVTVASPTYLDYAKALICSAEINFPSARIVVGLVNSGKDIKKEFEERNSNCKVILSSVDSKNERVFSSNQKCITMKKARDTGNNDILLWVDADSIIRRPCNDIYDILNKDMVVRLKDQKKTIFGKNIYDAYSGVFAIGNSKIGKDILDEYAKLTENNTMYWASDQDYVAYLYYKYKCNNPLPSYLLDFKMEAESLIWTLKCKPKSINGRFHRERDKYLALWKK